MNHSSNLQTTYSPLEERLNAISHGVGGIAAAIGLIFLLIKVDGIYGQFARVIH